MGLGRLAYLCTFWQQNKQVSGLVGEDGAVDLIGWLLMVLLSLSSHCILWGHVAWGGLDGNTKVHCGEDSVYESGVSQSPGRMDEHVCWEKWQFNLYVP